MANLSDTSYLARICYIPFVLIWMIIRIWQTSRWESFSFLRLARLEPRPLFTYTFVFALLVQLAHDIILYFIKFNEGYNIEPIIAEKPESDWTKKNLQLNEISNYLDSVSMSFTVTSLFTLQIFWSHVMEQLSRKQYTGTGIWEYWIYLVLAILLLPIFPIIVYLFGRFLLVEDPKYKEYIPRLSASGIALILCFVGGLRIHLGINRLLNSKSRTVSQNQGKLIYFQDLNIWFNFALFIWSASYLVISLDGILSVIITTRFISDLLIINVNFGELILYICIISIFNPDFSIKPKPRVISTPLDVSRTNSNITVMGPDGQIMVETSQDVKIERAFINPSYRPFSTTPPITPVSSKMDILTPMPSPSSVFAEGLNNRNRHISSPLRQSWQQQGQSISDGSSQYNDQAILTEHIGRFGDTQAAYDDESWQQEEISNEPQIYMENKNNNYNNMYRNDPIKRAPSQNDTLQKDMSLKDSMYSRSSSV